ncbi:MAG: TIM barrel protein [Clostridia bacterium]|nr:TIM barrel protein [Clostridia bacterium]
MAYFGPSGNEDGFYEAGYKSSVQMPEYVSKLGLDAYEYQCSRGVKITEKTANALGDEAKKYNIRLSIHAPYYINLATDDEQKRIHSIKYITDSMVAAKYMGADRVVVHSGACAKMERGIAMEYAVKTLNMAYDEAKNLGVEDVHICPETMGKINQLGDLEEVLTLCSINDSFLPTIDFGHLNARGLGALKEFEDYKHIFDRIEDVLGFDRLNMFHAHFSRIEFTAGGEKKHHTLDDVQFGPEFDPIARILAQRDIHPTIICESNGNMAQDALRLKNMYLAQRG